MRTVTRWGVLRHAKNLALVGVIALAGCLGGGGDATPSAPTLQSIEITSAHPSIAAGTSTQLSATAIYSDNSHADVTTQVAWASSNTAVATIGAATGNAVSVTPGTTTLNANLSAKSAST